MNKIVEVPLLAYKPRSKDAAVYKLSLGEYFYIGSSVNIADRIRKHLQKFIRGTNYKMLMEKFSSCEKIVFEILGTASGNLELRDLEAKFIEENKGSLFLLNKDSGTNIIIGFNRHSKRIKKISPDGSVEIFPSIEAAVKNANCNRSNFMYNIKMGYKTKGSTYRIIDSEGNDIIPPSRKEAKGKWKKKEAA